MVLVIPAVDRRVRAAQVLQREKPGAVGGVEIGACDELPGDLVPTLDGCALPPLAMYVCSSVRVEPVALPRPLTSLNSWPTADCRARAVAPNGTGRSSG